MTVFARVLALSAPVILAIAHGVAAAPDATPAMGFEVPGAWTTAPLELPGLMRHYGVTESDLWCAQAVHDRTWNIDSVPLTELAGGLTLSSAQVKEGKRSGRWDNLVRYPTLATADVPHQWSGATTLSLWIYADRATHDIVTLGIRSDRPDVPGHQYFLHSFRIDWSGWKLVAIPLNAFDAYGRPAGWDKVDAVCFFAKAFGNQPNPYTALYLDDLRLDRPGIDLATATVTSVPNAIPEKEEDGFVYRLLFQDRRLPAVNHDFPEKVEPVPPVGPVRFISHQTYFRTERDLFKYYPRFNAGFPSFDPAGRAYIFSGDVIQRLGDDGKWQVIELRPVLIAWAKAQGWRGMMNNWGAQGSDPSVRFDNAGDAYVLIQGEPLDAAGRRGKWTTRFAALLHSRDGMKTWTVYTLPGRMASFEKVDGHNLDCLKRPPVILLGDCKNFAESDKAGYLLLPAKKPDGSLSLPPPIKYADVCLGVNYHSGDGNIALSRGNKIFIVWGWCIDPSASPETVNALAAGRLAGGKWTLSSLKTTPVVGSLPPIPADHPGMKLTSRYRIHKERSSEYPEAHSCDGVPTFVVAYDIPTGTLSPPVYVGSGGGAIDSHNWPAITADSQGILHVIINGHHNPCTYAHSLRPDDISAWSAPEFISDRGGLPALSYASLNCDRDDTLYTLHRASTATYNDRLVLFRKKAGQPWESEQPMVAPFKRLYTAWYHHIAYDGRRNRLFVTYYALPNLTFLSRDMYEFLIFYHPELEAKLCSGMGKTGENPGPLPMIKSPFWDSWTYGGQYAPVASEPVTLVSDNGGQYWRLAVTGDYTAPAVGH